jgi:hypothetical protein
LIIVSHPLFRLRPIRNAAAPAAWIDAGQMNTHGAAPPDIEDH